MELVLGKSFKLEVWESIVQMMSLNEVALFTVDKSVSYIDMGCRLVLESIVLNTTSRLVIHISLAMKSECHTK